LWSETASRSSCGKLCGLPENASLTKFWFLMDIADGFAVFSLERLAE
jgi:hypothetical protein